MFPELVRPGDSNAENIRNVLHIIHRRSRKIINQFSDDVNNIADYPDQGYAYIRYLVEQIFGGCKPASAIEDLTAIKGLDDVCIQVRKNFSIGINPSTA